MGILQRNGKNQTLLSLLNNFAEGQSSTKWFELVLCIILTMLFIIELGNWLFIIGLGNYLFVAGGGVCPLVGFFCFVLFFWRGNQNEFRFKCTVMLQRLAVHWYSLHKILECLENTSYRGQMAGLLNESDVGANGQHLRISGWSKCTLASFYSKMVCEHSSLLFPCLIFVNYTQYLGRFLSLFSILRWLHPLTSFPKCHLGFPSSPLISKSSAQENCHGLSSPLLHSCPWPVLQWQPPSWSLS